MTKQLGFIGIDQYNNRYHIDKHPRKELIAQTGYSHVSKMYVDLKSGGAWQTGYVVGPFWIDVYRIYLWK